MLKSKPGGSFVGVVSDTHGQMPRSVLDALKGALHIIHAGDIETAEGLMLLGGLAPVTAVRGNMDRRALVAGLPRTALVEVSGISLLAIHDLNQLDLDPEAAGIRVVIHGHTHFAEIVTQGQVLYVNPGSPVRPRQCAASVVRLHLGGANLEAEIVSL